VKEQICFYLYLLATCLFIFGIKGLTGVRTARRGNQWAAVGMLIAIVTVIWQTETLTLWALVGGLAAGAAIGAFLAIRVQMTEMPELVAFFNGMGGAASALVGSAFVAVNYGTWNGATLVDSTELGVAITVPISILIGAGTLTGSLVAYLKLAGKKILHPVGGALRHYLHGLLGLGIVLLSVWLVTGANSGSTLFFAAGLLALVSCVLGVFLVMPIGGADMPVVVALLNSYSGLAAAASGFVVQNPMLVVAGALVGASGLILTRIMCKAMNRSLANVLLGGIGDDAMADDAREYKNIKETSAEEVAMLLDAATSVIVVPGYGLAVAQAQHTVRELQELLEARNVTVRYGIHPVAGRMPGHMNVLLAEADVPYELLFEMDKINGDFKNTDVVILLGANDVVNPAARTDKDSPIYGMPILDVDEAQTVIVVKRSLSPGYAGIRNPLFDLDNTLMMFSDAKAALQGMVKEVKDL
jgi:NAD(P) transhydrogenase subunit beta